jgi:hypothetical protein
VPTIGRRLSKRDVEALLAAYDGNPIGAIETALRQLLHAPTKTFDQLLECLLDEGRIELDRWRVLAGRDVDALDALVSELNETRTLPS